MTPISPSDGRATVPCKWCGKRTTYLGTRECDPCHQTALRLRFTSPGIIVKMLKEEEMLDAVEKAIKEVKDGREG